MVAKFKGTAAVADDSIVPEWVFEKLRATSNAGGGISRVISSAADAIGEAGNAASGALDVGAWALKYWWVFVLGALALGGVALYLKHSK
jgi:hypothetical protein